MGDEDPKVGRVNSKSRPAPPTRSDSFLERFRNRFRRRLDEEVGLTPSPGESKTSSPTDGSNDDPDAMRKRKPEGISSAVWEALQDVPKLGLSSVRTLFKVEEAAALNEYVDDRSYLMEDLISAAVKIAGDPVGDKITDGFLTTLYSDLKHPPEMCLGEKYKYRSADGSNNSFLYPDLGKAGQPYARSVKPVTVQPAVLPDPSVIFDSVLLRKAPEQHPNRISSILFYLASIIIHDCFRTSHTDFGVSETSSYLDLSPLYGSNEKEQNTMRTFQDGKIKPDCFSETRLLSFPPGVGALLISFNRFHNFVVEQLGLINEGGRFDKPSPANRKTPEQHDNDLFQTGRLVTCGLYVNIILIDYVRTILNLNRTDKNWQLNPREVFPGGPPLGAGNQVSAEFNLVYRWHAAVSDRDDKWTQDLFSTLFQGRTPDQVPQREFLITLGAMEKELHTMDPVERPFAKLTRQPDGTYKDEDLAEILVSSVDDCANAFGPQQIPAVLKAVEVLGMQQARSWNLATLNEFRKHFALKPHEHFSDITRNKNVAQQLERLYGHPDNVELYPGLVVEDAKEPRYPGSGLCPSFTTSRAVLSDAVALVRGDRFYTTSYQPKSLTNWGYAEVDYDLDVDNGCCMYKLFLRAFPNHFHQDSVHIHYPMTESAEMRVILINLDKEDRYVYDMPKTSPIEPMIMSTLAEAKHILSDNTSCRRRLGPAIYLLDDKTRAQARDLHKVEQAMLKLTCEDMDGLSRLTRGFFEDTTAKLLREESYNLANFQEVDIVKDVINRVTILYCAELLSIPLKVDDKSDGIVTVDELRTLMGGILISLSDFDPVQSVILRSKSRSKVQELRKEMVKEFSHVKQHKSYSTEHEGLLHKTKSTLRFTGLKLILGLMKSGLDAQEAFCAALILGSSMAMKQSALLSEAIDYMLKHDHDRLETISTLAQKPSAEADDQFLRYVLELVRLSGQSLAFREVTTPTTVGTSTNLKQNDLINLMCHKANTDPTTFPDPRTINLTRPISSYLPLDANINIPLWESLHRIALPSILRTIIRQCPNLRSARVWNGTSVPDALKRVPAALYGRPAQAPKQDKVGNLLATVQAEVQEEQIREGESVVLEKEGCEEYYAFMDEKWDRLSPFPTTLKVNWDITPANGVNGHAGSAAQIQEPKTNGIGK